MQPRDYLDWLRAQGRERGLSASTVEACVEYATRLLDRGLPVIYDDHHLALHLGADLRRLWGVVHAPEASYREFRIPKRHGGYRRILAPKPVLKAWQRWVNAEVLANVELPACCTGFRGGGSAIVNARPHSTAKCVLNMDIKDFFPTITSDRVYRVWRDMGYSRRVSHVLTGITTCEGALPQGAPTSPALSNIVPRRLDARLSGLARSAAAAYTRYADDLTFSGGRGIGSLIPRVESIVADEGFAINRGKTRVMRSHRPQMVTGLTVNQGVSVPRRLRRRVRQQAYYCRRWGPASHRERTGDGRGNLRDHLYGWAYYIMGLHPEEANQLLDTLARVDWDS